MSCIEETIVPAASEVQRSFDNAKEDAVNYGVELESRIDLSRISSFLRNFLVNFNCTMVHSRIDVHQGLVNDSRSLWGQSPYTINASLYYTNPENQTGINLSYNVAGRRIVQVAQVGAFAFDDPHVYERPHNQLDLSVSQVLFENVALKFSAKALLNEAVEWE